jgi:hypothetical protein
MKTTVDIDEGVLREAEAQARYQGKPLGALVEEALRVTVKTAAGYQPVATPPVKVSVRGIVTFLRLPGPGSPLARKFHTARPAGPLAWRSTEDNQCPTVNRA